MIDVKQKKLPGIARTVFQNSHNYQTFAELNVIAQFAGLPPP
jgi:hypothetical protein